jgi:ketosteroid isomerase-like protein
MSVANNVRVVLEAFRCVERRDDPGLIGLYHPDIEFHWPASLPYGGTRRIFDSDGNQLPRRAGTPTFDSTWDPLQPTEKERRMDPQVVATSEDDVVVLYQQRGVSPGGERFETPVLGVYRVRDGKLARAQMFYFDTAAVLHFLDASGTPGGDSQAPDDKPAGRDVAR